MTGTEQSPEAGILQARAACALARMLLAGLVGVFFLAPAGGDLLSRELHCRSPQRGAAILCLRVLQRPRNEFLARAEETGAHGAIEIARKAKGPRNWVDLLAGGNGRFPCNAVVTNSFRGAHFKEGEDCFRVVHPDKHIGREPRFGYAVNGRKFQTSALAKNFLDKLLQVSI